MLPTDYQKFIHTSRYARWNEEVGRREIWEETVSRYFNFFGGHLKENHDYDMEFGLNLEVLRELQLAVTNLEVMPSMRCLMTAGPALKRDSIVGYNCSYTPIDNVRSFDEILFILMCGTGVGFSVERQYVNQLPVVPERLEDSTTTITVRDSKRGWAEGFRELLGLLYAGRIPSWDTSKLREAGARLKTMGGRSSGPGPLIELFEFTVRLFKKAEGRKLTSLECHDLVCKVGECVVVGGVRRSALLSLSNLSDQRMRDAKSGEWYTMEPQRSLSNNSVAYTETPEVGQFMEEWLSLYQSKSGERGIFNREAARIQAMKSGRRKGDYGNGTEGKPIDFGCNPCAEIILRPRQLCNLTTIVVRPEDTLESLEDKVRKAAILGTWQSTLTNFRYLTKKWSDNCNEERLLGVSMTGIMSNQFLNGWSAYLPNLLDHLRETAVATNKEWAERLGIPQSTAVTCVKPEGTASQLVSAASGIHPAYSQYYIRRVRQDIKDPLTTMLIDQGLPYEQDVMNKENIVFSFPQKAPEGSVLRNDMSAIEQLEHWKIFQDHWCVTGDTDILTRSGYRKIEELVDQEIEVWNGYEWAVVSPFETGKADVFRVNFSDGSCVDMTEDHKILCADEERRSLKELEIGQTIFSDFEFPTLEGGIDDGLPDAYTQGFYAGDGYEKGNWTLIYPPKYVCIPHLSGKINDWETSNRGRCWKHADAKVLPRNTVPLTAPIDYKVKWLAGLIDADGNKLGPGVQITSVNYNFVREVGLLLNTLGCKSILQEKPKSGYGISSYFCVNISGRYTSKLLQLGLDTHRVQLRLLKKQHPLRAIYIKTVSLLGSQATFCFTEPKRNLGIFNGVLLGQCEHKPSITVYVREKEWPEVGGWVWKHFDSMSGVSFLPHSDHIYKQAPYEEINEDKYNELVAEMPEIEWSQLGSYETEDNTTGQQELACSAAGGCEI